MDIFTDERTTQQTALIENLISDISSKNKEQLQVLLPEKDISSEIFQIESFIRESFNKTLGFLQAQIQEKDAKIDHLQKKIDEINETENIKKTNAFQQELEKFEEKFKNFETYREMYEGQIIKLTTEKESLINENLALKEKFEVKDKTIELNDGNVEDTEKSIENNKIIQQVILEKEKYSSLYAETLKKLEKVHEKYENEKKIIKESFKSEELKELLQEISALRQRIEKQSTENLNLQEINQKISENSKAQLAEFKETQKSLQDSLSINLSKIESLNSQITDLKNEKNQENIAMKKQIEEKNEEIKKLSEIKENLEKELINEEVLYEKSMQSIDLDEKTNAQLKEEIQSLSEKKENLKKLLYTKTQEFENISNKYNKLIFTFESEKDNYKRLLQEQNLKYNELLAIYNHNLVSFEAEKNNLNQLLFANENLLTENAELKREKKLLKEEVNIIQKEIMTSDENSKAKLKAVVDIVKSLPSIISKALYQNVYDRNRVLSHVNDPNIWLCDFCGSINYIHDQNCFLCITTSSLPKDLLHPLFSND